MKNVGIIYANSLNAAAMNYVIRSLEEVFGEYVKFTNYYMDTFNETTLLDEDAYLIANEVPFQDIKNHVSDYTVIIKVNRSPQRTALEKISSIPDGSNVLVVNDGYENAMETVTSFHQVGMGRLTLIPYDFNLEHTGIYDDLTIAITPGEADLVPPHITQIIDIGYRMVSFDTMYTLMKMLDLDIDIINRNLFRHIQLLMEPSTAFHDSYINGYLKSEMLNHMSNKDRLALLLVNSNFRTVYANTKALSIFQATDMKRINILDHIDPAILTDAEAITEMVQINGESYYYNKYAFMLMDETVGYYITLQDESDMADSSRQNLQKGYVAKYQFKDIVHNAPTMDEIITKARQISPTDYTVLIRGESGTGKELMAQSIHNASYRNKAPFIAINCAALPENLLESELFGYDSGAFTGAKNSGKVGLFEQANHGTLFLDEIGDLSSNLQSHLLRTIQEKQIMRLGSDRLVDVDIRLITATNKDLESAVNDGLFRKDLFFRLNVLPLTIPPLRQRKEDILPLMEHFLGSAYRNLTPSELDVLTSYDWPGNVRELENVAVYYNALSSLPDYLCQTASADYNSSFAMDPKHDAESILLGVIASNTAVSHGIGRSALLHILKERSVNVSDGKLREMLASLQSRGLVEIGRGRGGTSITPLGLKKLKEADKPK